MSNNYDIAIIGLGAVGSAALYAASRLSKLGLKAMGIDRFTPLYSLSSSHGETRIIRRAINLTYCKLSIRSCILWHGITTLTDIKLFNSNGCLTLAPNDKADEIFAEKINCAELFLDK